MNKSYVILGGACVLSSTIGAAGGYLIAKKKFDAQLDRSIAVEVEKTKKYFAIQRMQAEKPALTEIVTSDPSAAEATAVEEDDEEPEELTEADQAAIKKGRASLARASTAMTDYQGMAGNKVPLDQLVDSNIFNTTKGKKALPPRGENGKFLPKSDIQKPQDNPSPYIIEPDAFLANDPEHDQESLLWFVNNQTLIMVVDHEVVADDLVGEDNLTEFPDDEEPSVIYVRNEGAQIDYQITLTKESLTAFMGLGEEEEDDDDAMGDFREEGDLRQNH